jgi:hypothetical protein
MRAGFGRVVFVIRREIEAPFRRAFVDRTFGAIDVAYCFQEADDLPPGFAVPAGRSAPWGTGHAILAARREVDGPFATINADDFYGRDAFATVAQFLREVRDEASARACLVAFRLANTLSEHGSVSRGICRTDADGSLREVIETHGIRAGDDGQFSFELGDARTCTPLSGNERVSMNLWGFTPSIFDLLQRRFAAFLEAAGSDTKAEFYAPAAITEAIAEGSLGVQLLSTDARWFGVTFQPDRTLVQAALRRLTAQGLYPSPLWGAARSGALEQ